MEKQSRRKRSLENCNSFDEFLRKIKDQERIRLVKLRDEGLVEPAHQGGAIVMQPRIRIVVSAFDPVELKVFRWEQKYDAGSVVTIHTNGKGTHKDQSTIMTIESIRRRLEDEQYMVTDGEFGTGNST